MLQSHLVLMPSRAEPVGLVGLEAIAAGVPVLVSDKSGLADMINQFAPRYHNCIVETYAGGNDQRNVGNWARCIERVLRHCEAEFETAANLKRELLATKYWEESERLFINVCTTEGVSSPRLGDNNTGTQGNEGPLGSSSDEESLQENNRILRISEKIFDEEVLNNPEELEKRLLDFRQHVEDALHYFKLSCKAKLRIKRSVKHHAAKVHRVLFPEIKLRSRYGKLVKCFKLYCATLKKVEDGCVLCTLEFDGTRDFVTFLRGYRDGKLSETLTQELITEEMQEKEGPGVCVHVTLLVASDTTRTGDKGSKPEETDRTQVDEEMKETIATEASDTPEDSTSEPMRTTETTQTLQVGTEEGWSASAPLETSASDPRNAEVMELQAALPTPEQTGHEMTGLQGTLVKMEELPASTNASPLEIEHYKKLAMVYSKSEQMENAMSSYESALALARETGNKGEEMEVCFLMGEMYREQLHSQLDAIESYEQFLTLAKDLMVRKNEGLAYNRLGLAHYEIGEYDQGHQHHGNSLKVSEDDEDIKRMTIANINMGNTARLLGKLDQAYFHFDTALQMAQQAGDRRSEMEVYFWMGEMHMEQLHSPRAAVTYYERHLALAKEFGDREEERIAYNRLGMAFYEAGEYELALDWHIKCLEMVQDRQNKQEPHANIGDCYKALGNLDQANRHYQLALNMDTGHKQRQEDIAKKLASLEQQF
ncbi:uncharacterized protein LOC144882001 [Branchiostoma floridae x Branchiostoma japonicum]